MRIEFKNLSKHTIFQWDNYSKPTWGMARLHFAYLWFKTLHYAYLNFNLLSICYPPHPQTLEKHHFIKNQT